MLTRAGDETVRFPTWEILRTTHQQKRPNDVGFRGNRNRVKRCRSLDQMAIDKESDGIPEVDLSRRTTKVNLWMIVAVGLFFVITGLVVYFFAK